jgi:glycosyltransferase involved in cell wall biosynthesis
MPGELKNISVLMPAYNSGKYIAASIKCILNQSIKDFEFVIINDGSTDNTEDVIKGFVDSRIRYFKTEHKGTSHALNFGAGLCTNEWVARIDSDDLNVPERLKTQLEYLNKNQDKDVISSWSVYFRDPGKILFNLKAPLEHEDIYAFLDLHNPLNQSGLVIRKKLLLENPFDETLNGFEDFELYYRIRDKVIFANVPEFLVFTRSRKDSRSVIADRTHIREMLFNPSFKNMIGAKSKGGHFYWATVIAWVTYFYGNRRESRSYFKNSLSLKNLTAYFTTFLPDEYFHKFINYRLKYRLKSIFAGTNKIHKTELKKLIN